MPDYGRVTTNIAEAAVTVPTADAAGRVTTVVGEVAVTVPTADAAGRVTEVIAEAALVDQDEVRVVFSLVEVWSQATTEQVLPVKALRGGIQGRRASSLRRR